MEYLGFCGVLRKELSDSVCAFVRGVYNAELE